MARIQTAEGYKFCNKCREVKEETEFAEQKSRSDGRAPYCKKCMRKYKRKHDYKELRAGQVVGDFTLLHRIENGRWLCKCTCGKEESKIPSNLHNRRGIKCRHRKYEKDPPMLWKAYRGIAHRYNWPFEIRPEEFEELYSGSCRFCGIAPANGVGRAVKEKGYVSGNCHPVCSTCVRARGDMTMDAFEQWILDAAKWLWPEYIDYNVR